jgi:hypothetical protein
MMSWFLWIEQSPLSVWVRESSTLFAFPFILFLHTLGLAMLAGLSVGIDIWLLMMAEPRMPRVSMQGIFKVMWLGFGVNAVSGVLLLMAYPAKALTNWVFFAKMLFILFALIGVESLKKEVFAEARPGEVLAVSHRAKMLAVGTLLLWGGTVVAGRLLAYTHHILMASDPWAR